MDTSIRLITLVFLVGLIDHTTTKNSPLTRGQSAVTSFADLEQFYIRVKTQTPLTYVSGGQLHHEDYSSCSPSTPQVITPTKEKQQQDLEDKNRICALIFDSNFFKVAGLESANFCAEEIAERVRLHNDIIYNDIYPTSKSDHIEWLNPYKLRKDTQTSLDEYVFRCVVKDKDWSTLSYSPSEYIGYFISPVYQSRDLAIDGRFVFNDGMNLVAFAEQPGKEDPEVVRSTRLTYYMAKARTEPDIATSLLCTLSAGEKIRLCAVVLTALKDTVEFITKEDYKSEEDNIQTECRKREVYGGRNPNVDTFFETEMRYDEFMIGCKAVSLSTNERKIYYISRGVDAFTAIVFEPSDVDKEPYKPIAGVNNVHLVKGRGPNWPVREVKRAIRRNTNLK